DGHRDGRRERLDDVAELARLGSQLPELQCPVHVAAVRRLGRGSSRRAAVHGEEADESEERHELECSGLPHFVSPLKIPTQIPPLWKSAHLSRLFEDKEPGAENPEDESPRYPRIRLSDPDLRLGGIDDVPAVDA